MGSKGVEPPKRRALSTGSYGAPKPLEPPSSHGIMRQRKRKKAAQTFKPYGGAAPPLGWGASSQGQCCSAHLVTSACTFLDYMCAARHGTGRHFHAPRFEPHAPHTQTTSILGLAPTNVHLTELVSRCITMVPPLVDCESNKCCKRHSNTMCHIALARTIHAPGTMLRCTGIQISGGWDLRFLP